MSPQKGKNWPIALYRERFPNDARLFPVDSRKKHCFS
jgi:hypothetical protein